MKTTIKVTLAVALAAAVAVAMLHMPTFAADEHASHGMTAEEHLAHMSAAGDIHAGHALDEIKWAATPRQAAAGTAALPADDMGAVERLAKSPRKGEFVTVNVGGTPMRTWVVQPAGTGAHRLLSSFRRSSA